MTLINEEERRSRIKEARSGGKESKVRINVTK